MTQELFELETYNDGANTATVRLRRMVIDYTRPENPGLVVIMEETRTGAAGEVVAPFTMHATNEMQVPIYRKLADGTYEPVLEETGELNEDGTPVMRQQTIGEFDMWKVLVFQGNHISINAAIDSGVRRKKGITTDPLIFVMP